MQNRSNPMCPSIGEILNLQFTAGKGYNSINCYKSALWKLAMLLTLCSASRGSDLCRLSINHRTWSVHKITFHPVGVAEQSRVGHLPTPIDNYLTHYYVL